MPFDSEVKRVNEKRFEEMLKLQRPEETRGAASVTPVELTDANFVQVVNSHPLVVVDFWAPWCGPCRVVSPVLEQLASEMAGEATFGKLNVDDNPVTSRQFGIQSIPTIVVFKDGVPVDGRVGAAPKNVIEGKVRPYIGGGRRDYPYQ